jgi:hypothetical protein
METKGTLSLKIARLQRRLAILASQQILSHAYPAHLQRLQDETLALRAELDKLIKLQQAMVPVPAVDCWALSLA